jgi:iron-sulfur cluster repair protein YtfE (RIC family)
MKTIARCYSSHIELRERVAELRSLITTAKLRIRPTAHNVYELLMDLVERVQLHLDGENRCLFPHLLIHEHSRVKSIVWTFIANEQPLRLAINSYSNNHLLNGYLDCSETLVSETQQVLDMLMTRLDQEERVLFPKVAEMGLLHQVCA